MEHPFNPVFDAESKILILGTFPSVKSREYGFFYGHPYNRFWKLLSKLTNSEKVPKLIPEKIQFLIRNRIALWDTIKSCDIEGSKDSSVRNIIPNDLHYILDNSKIEKIYANGSKAFEIYMKYCYPETNKNIIKLPSTSPANAMYSFEKLLVAWKKNIIGI